MADNRDFFDEEYDKQTQREEERRQTEFDSWNSQPSPQPVQSKGRRALLISVICVGLVLCIVLGWVLCSIFTHQTETNSVDASEFGGVMTDEIIQFVKENYFQDISDEQWTQAVEASGTALLQSLGEPYADYYSHIMSPQTYYDFIHPQPTIGSVINEVYGVSYVVEEGVGMRVSAVSANSAAYGRLRENDIVIKLTDIKTASGTAPQVGGYVFDEMLLSQWSSAAIQQVVNMSKSATFHVLRLNSDGSYQIIDDINITRSKLQYVNSDYPYEFVEFYFGDDCTNISLRPLGNAATSTYDERHLDMLPADTGYVRIVEFMSYNVGITEEITAADEFAEVMGLFKERNLKHLVLDLRGNPGGNVDVVSDIAGMLINDNHLTEAQKTQLSTGTSVVQYLITTLDYTKQNTAYPKYRTLTYNDYFPAEENGKCNIAVWTDENSASASELLTGALRDYGTAVQMGTTTYGKGIAQTWTTLPFTGTAVTATGQTVQSNWAIYFTCASYYSPLGTNIHGVGYTPDAQYDGLTEYEQLWQAVNNYWK